MPVTKACLKWRVAIEGIAALVDEQTSANDRGGNAQPGTARSLQKLAKANLLNESDNSFILGPQTLINP